MQWFVKLIQQIKETEATLENARARLQQLKNDSAWRKFWHGENKVIKELEKETIPELEATLQNLKTKATDLTYEYKEAEINTQKDLEKKREQDANKAIQDAKRVADERKTILRTETAGPAAIAMLMYALEM